jgi:F-type H+-transporting ATPase subunit gamma
MTADRGLCGGFNGNVIRKAAQEIKGLGADASLIVVGRKSRDFFQRRGYNIAKEYIGLGDNIKYASARDCLLRC